MDGKSFYFLLSGAFLTLLTSIICLDWYFFWNSPTASQSAVFTQITINKGDSIKKVSKKMLETEIFSRPLYLKIYLEYQSLFHYFKYGDYLINPQDTPTEILQQLVEGRIKLYKFTITPGMTWIQLKSKIHDSGLFEEDLNTEKKLEDFCYKHNIPSLEGWLAPDSYFIAKYSKESVLLNMAIEQQKKVIRTVVEEKSCYLDIDDVVSLASIIEKESGYAQEYALISSTYHNRLRKGMRLQSDPTVRYAQIHLEGKKLTHHDLRQSHSHNTYTNKGLPPTAIGYPSKDAIIAACNPAKTEYLYFVADKERYRHIFTTNYKDHLHVKNAQRQP